MDVSMTPTVAQRRIAILSAIFAFSGIAALTYQIVWQRLLFLVFGVDIESVTVIVSTFMLGLGFGGLLGGYLADKARDRCVLYFSIFELGIGVFGACSHYLIGLLGTADGAWAIAGKSTLLLLTPTVLMGATLPLLSVALVDKGNLVGEAVGKLYYFNTLGAAIACLLLGFLFFDYFGLQQALYGAALLNFLVAYQGWRIWRLW